MFNSFQTIEIKNKIFIHDDHECKIGAMTPQEILKHFKNEGDYIHTAISMYLETLNTFSQGHGTSVDPIFDLPNFMLSTVTLMCI
jgi:hypothetical protein